MQAVLRLSQTGNDSISPTKNSLKTSQPLLINRKSGETTTG